MNVKQLLVALLLLGGTLALRAQDHPMEAPGFVPNKVYDVHDLDSVNTFNGNLVATIAIGPAFHVNGALSYGLALHYNSHAWNYWLDEATIQLNPQCQIDLQYYKWVCYEAYSLPSLRSNAALGWTLSLGRLWGPNDVLNGISREGVAWNGGFTYRIPTAPRTHLHLSHRQMSSRSARFSRTVPIEVPGARYHPCLSTRETESPGNSTWSRESGGSRNLGRQNHVDITYSPDG